MVADLQEKYKDLSKLRLSAGTHASPDDGACPMELVSWIAGEQWSDQPQCACPVIATFIRAWNDALHEGTRTALLLPLVPRLVGTRANGEIELRRALMAADWMVRVNAPSWLRLAGLRFEAESLALFTEITSLENASAWQPQLEAATSASREACEAAWMTEWNTGRDAPRDATWFDAWETTWAGPHAVCQRFVWHPVWEIARETAQNAAGAAFWGPQREGIRLPTPELTQSTIALIDRMIAAKPF